MKALNLLMVASGMLLAACAAAPKPGVSAVADLSSPFFAAAEAVDARTA